MVTDEVEVAPEVSAPVDETSTSEVSSDETSTEGTDSTQTPAPIAANAYTPDYKYKVDHVEKELADPFLKDLIKDADSEKKVKEIARKYEAFDEVYGRHTKLKEKFDGYEAQTKPIVDTYNDFQKYYAKEDYDSLFELLKIPQQKIFEYAIQKAEELRLPADQRAYIEQQRQVQRQKEYLENQNQSLQSQQFEQLSRFRAQELGWVMARPDVHGVASAFDAKNGQGAFRELVRETGLAHHARTRGQEDLPVDAAVEKVMKMIGAFVQTNPAGPSLAPTQALIPQNGAPPIIPNVTSGNASPVKKQARSISDLKARREELLTQSS